MSYRNAKLQYNLQMAQNDGLYSMQQVICAEG